MSVLQAVEADLSKIRERDEALADSALAATAKQLACEMDGSNSATSKAMCAKALMEAMDRLHDLAPAEKETDNVDDLAKRRAERREAAAAG